MPGTLDTLGCLQEVSVNRRSIVKRNNGECAYVTLAGEKEKTVVSRDVGGYFKKILYLSVSFSMFKVERSC